MNINIPLTEQVEATLRRKAAIAGQELGEYIQRLIIDDAEEAFPSPPSGETAESFNRRLDSLINHYDVRCGHVDDRRESIYAGRGE